MKPENTTMSTTEKISFFISLSTMIAAGITLISAISSLLEDAKGNQKKILESIKNDIFQGKRFYIACQRFPAVFDKVTINIIRASEEAGTLDTTLKQINENIRGEKEFNDRIKSALMYPIFIMFVFVGVFLMILFVVIPKIAVVFLQLKVPLPLPTKILIFLSNAATHYTLFILGGLVVIVTGFYFLYRAQKRRIQQFIFTLPMISKLVQMIDLTRFTRSMYMLLYAGILITSSLDLTYDVVLNKEVAEMIKHCRTVVLSGKKLSEGMRAYKGIVPSLVIKIIEAGEVSGSLDKSLKQVSEYLDYEVSNTLRTLTALLEPIMLVFVGVMVGGMMLSIIAPIYGLISQVGGTH